MKRYLSFFLALAAVCATAQSGVATASSPSQSRRLVWSDEFNGCALDPAKWQFWGTMSSTDNVYTNDALYPEWVMGRGRIHADPNPFVLVVR